MTGKTITRADLSESVYQEVGLSRNESAELVDTVLEEISAALTRGESVKISSFGSFLVRMTGWSASASAGTSPGGSGTSGAIGQPRPAPAPAAAP